MEITKKTYSICQNCILIDGSFGVKVNSNGLCSYCSNPNFVTSTWKKVVIENILKREKIDNWIKTVKEMQENYGSKEFSCVLGYSGGKDSTALLDTFVNEYNLRPYLVTVDTGFMTDVAKKNIKNTLSKLGLENNHIFIEEAIPTFTKLYKYFFLSFHPQPNGKALTLEICHICTDLIHTVLVIEAMKKGLNHVIIGFSPDQIARYFYEASPEDVLKDSLPRPVDFENILVANDLKWYLNKDTSLKDLPRVLYPYHVIDYDEKEIINRIESKGLIEVGKGDPVLTNCHVVKAGLMYDLYRFGGIAYAVQYAELIRQEEDDEKRKKARKEWIRVMSRVGRNILNGTFNLEGMNLFFKRIGSSKDNLIKKISIQVKGDPNANQILKNIELFKLRKLK